MDIPFADLKPMHNEIRHELDMAYKKVMDNSWFIQGGELEAFEKEFANYIGVKHCIGVATGLDALYLVLKAYGIGCFLRRSNTGVCGASIGNVQY